MSKFDSSSLIATQHGNSTSLDMLEVQTAAAGLTAYFKMKKRKPSGATPLSIWLLICLSCLGTGRLSAEFTSDEHGQITRVGSALTSRVEAVSRRMLQQDASTCPYASFNVTTSVYAVGSGSSTEVMSSLPTCLGQTSCQLTVSETESCTSTLQLRSTSLTDQPRNCSSGSDLVYACKGFVVSPDVYNSAASGHCADDWQQQTVHCPAAQLQRSVYQAITSGRCSVECIATANTYQLVSTLGSGQCKRLALRFTAQSFTEAVKLRQTIEAVALDALNTCWTSSSSSWQALALDRTGMQLANTSPQHQHNGMR